MKYVIISTLAIGAQASIDSLLADVAALTNEKYVPTPPPLTADERLAQKKERQAKKSRENPLGMFGSVFKMVAMGKGMGDGSSMMSMLPQVFAMMSGGGGSPVASIMEMLTQGDFEFDPNNPLGAFEKLLGPGMVEQIVGHLTSDPDVSSKMTQLFSMFGGPDAFDQVGKMFGGENSILDAFENVPGIDKLMDHFDAGHGSALARAPKQLETIISHLEFAASTEADEEAIHKYNEIAGLLARATVLFEDVIPAADETASAGGAKGAPNLQALFGSVDLTKIMGGFAAGGNSDVMMNMAQMMMSNMMKNGGAQESDEEEEDEVDEEEVVDLEL